MEDVLIADEFAFDFESLDVPTFLVTDFAEITLGLSAVSLDGGNFASALISAIGEDVYADVDISVTDHSSLISGEIWASA